MEFDTNMLNVLACPICKGKVHYDAEGQELICRVDKLAYPIHDGMPIMLVSSARKWEQQ